MEYVPLESILQPGQEYVKEYFSQPGNEIKVIKHIRATNTCPEKLVLLHEEGLKNWKLNQVVKAVYLYGTKEESIGNFYLFIFPEVDARGNELKVNNDTIESIYQTEGLKYDYKKADPLMNLRNHITPVGMESGTCPPFFPDFHLKGDGFTGKLAGVYIYDDPSLDDEEVDVSTGGYGDLAHRISAQTMYKHIHGCINSSYPNLINKVKW